MEQSMRSLGRFHADQESGSLAFARLPACVCVCVGVCVCVPVCLEYWDAMDCLETLLHQSLCVCLCVLQGGSFI